MYKIKLFEMANDVPPTYYDVQSITKAALGLVYAKEGVDTSAPLWPAWKDSDLTLQDALDHHAGMHDDDGPFTFDYNAFRGAVGKDATAYAEKHLRQRQRCKGEFGYSNLAWQLLAYRFGEVAGKTPDKALADLIGRGGWMWEPDAKGTCLGPHGLSMTKAAAKRLGAAAREQFKEADFVQETPISFWSFANIEAVRYVHNGWFAYKKPYFTMYATGFLAQYIVVRGEEVHLQLRAKEPICEGNPYFDFDKVTDEENAFLKSLVQSSTLALTGWRVT